MTPSRITRIGDVALGGAVLLLGLFVAFETFEATVAISGAGGGPKLFPYLIAGGLTIIGGWLISAAFRPQVEAREALELDWPPVAVIAAGFLLVILLMERVGWIVAGTALFALAARGFGSRRILVDLAIGLVLTALTFALFDYALGLDLPTGTIIEDLIDPPDEAA